MNDFQAVLAPKSDQINAQDLLSGDMTITIKSVKVTPGAEQPVSIAFEGSDKVWRPCKTTGRILMAAWGADTSTYPGRSVQLYLDPDVKWGGLKVGGIRIRAVSHIDAELKLALAESKQSRKLVTVQVLRAAPKPAAPEEPDAGPIHIAARAMAAKGTETFRKWYRDNPSYRAAAQTIIGELQDICAKADAAAMEADPFGLPPLAEPTPTAADLARAEQEALAAIERQSRDAGE